MVVHTGIEKESGRLKVSKVLLWSTAPQARTAFAKNTFNLALRLKDAGHEVAIFAFTGLGLGQIEYGGITVFPNNAPDHGETYLPIWANHYKPDVIIQHFDLYSLGDYLSQVKDKLPPIYVYPPVDHDPYPPSLVRALQGASKVIAMTKFAQNRFREAGIESVYIPHAVDTEIYYPSSKEAARKEMDFPYNHFLLLSVATNKGPRKNLGNVLRAFRDFLIAIPEARSEAYLYIHAYVHGGEKNPHGYDLPEIWNNLGIADNIKCTHPVFYDAIGYTEEEVANLYRAADWTILCSLGEGFGLPLIESLACSTPVIYSNFSALPEVVGPGGLPVEASESITFEISNSFQYIPSTNEITSSIIEAYLDWKLSDVSLRNELGAKGRQHVLQNYDYKVVMPKWLDLIK